MQHYIKTTSTLVCKLQLVIILSNVRPICKTEKYQQNAFHRRKLQDLDPIRPVPVRPVPTRPVPTRPVSQLAHFPTRPLPNSPSSQFAHFPTRPVPNLVPKKTTT